MTSSNSNPSATFRTRFYSIAASIGPIFVSVVLCGGLIERFKDDTAFRKDIVATYYHPMVLDQHECEQTHRTYIEKRNGIGGSYRLMINEFRELTINRRHVTPEYGNLLESILMNNQKVHKDADDFFRKTSDCKVKLLQRYQEMSLVTGTYSEYKKLLSNRDKRLEEISKAGIAERKIIAGDTDRYDPEKLMTVLRDMLQGSFDTPEAMASAYKRIENLAEPVINLQFSMGKEEMKILQVDQEFSTQLQDVYAKEIDARFSRPFISKLIF